MAETPKKRWLLWLKSSKKAVAMAKIRLERPEFGNELLGLHMVQKTEFVFLIWQDCLQDQRVVSEILGSKACLKI
jgi:hypothetical protein